MAIDQNAIRITIPAGGTLDMTIPVSLTSGRVYFGAGDVWFGVVAGGAGEGIVQPASQNKDDLSGKIFWGFVEFTLADSGYIFANISYADFAGLPIGLQLAVNGGSTQQALGLKPNVVVDICSGLNAQQAVDGRPWGSFCLTNNSTPLRAIPPLKYSEIDPAGFAKYWDNYVNQVWSKYTSTPLVIDTQSSAGKVNCQVSGSVMTCGGGDSSNTPSKLAFFIGHS